MPVETVATYNKPLHKKAKVAVSDITIIVCFYVSNVEQKQF